jgi:hypothetical protein
MDGERFGSQRRPALRGNRRQQLVFVLQVEAKHPTAGCPDFARALGDACGIAQQKVRQNEASIGAVEIKSWINRAAVELVVVPVEYVDSSNESLLACRLGEHVAEHPVAAICLVWLAGEDGESRAPPGQTVARGDTDVDVTLPRRITDLNELR